MGLLVHDNRRPDYGVDAPRVVGALLVVGLCFLCVGALYGRARWLAVSSLFLFASGAAMIYSSRVGKMRARERALNRLAWQGTEHVLDVGCGRGLMLNGAARRLTTGRAIGIDIWRAEDLSDNNSAAALANARLEGVEPLIQVRDGDARNLPFGDGEFDVVVSSQCLHNIASSAERRKALSEIVRVLKPGGAAAIVDFRNTSGYATTLQRLGMVDVRRSGLGLTYFPPSAVVTARKPAAPTSRG